MDTLYTSLVIYNKNRRIFEARKRNVSRKKPAEKYWWPDLFVW